MLLEPLPPPSADLAESLPGVWRLVSRIDLDAQGNRLIDPVLGGEPLGIVCWSGSRFAAQFMKRDFRGAGAPAPGPVAAGDATACTNNTVALSGYDAYFGSYTVDAAAGQVAIRIEGSIVPANIGHAMTRDVRVVGDRMFIRIETLTPDGVPITRTLVFERG